MDSKRFDRLARRLAAGTDRRRFLRGAAALAVGGLGLASAADRADAACPAGQVKRSGGGCVCKGTGRPPAAKPRCPTGQIACGGCCVPACKGDNILDAATCACAAPPCPLNDCEAPHINTTGSSSIPPAKVFFSIIDDGSGVASVEAISTLNVTVEIFDPPPGGFQTTAIATKIDDILPALVQLRATDLAGNVSTSIPISF
jgi:hypothetical protein